MATTTPNYGWTVPTSTDLVKDGATAIETLGDAIDASMNTALGTKKAGMVLLNTTSFSAVASQSVNNVFSSTYDNYLIVLECIASGGSYVNFRLRVGGVDASGANYDWGFYNVTDGGTPFALAGSGATSANILRPSASFRSMTSFTICNPAIARPTVSSGTLSYNDGSTKAVAGIMGNVHSVSTAYDGFTLINSGTITGQVSVYGQNK
jgi:hypothetical protein